MSTVLQTGTERARKGSLCFALDKRRQGVVAGMSWLRPIAFEKLSDLRASIRLKFGEEIEDGLPRHRRHESHSGKGWDGMTAFRRPRYESVFALSRKRFWFPMGLRTRDALASCTVVSIRLVNDISTNAKLTEVPGEATD